MVGDSVVMRTVKERIAKVARSMAPVLVHGESGTGKELAALALHANSHRAAGPLVAVNCSAIPESLLEAEFFGARKGSYTGAAQDRIGFFQAAQGGTLFLDEIGDLPAVHAVQAAAGDTGALRAPAGRGAGGAGGRAHRQRHAQGPGGGGARGGVSGKTCTTASTSSTSTSPRCASAARTCPRCARRC